MDQAHSDLTFNVAQLLKESVGSTRLLELDTPELTLSDHSFDPDETAVVEAYDVNGAVKVTRISHDLLVQGDVAADVAVQCSRCLTEFRLPVEAGLEENFQPTIDIVTGRPVHRAPEDEDETAFEISANHEIDLAEPVRQALLVAMPLNPVCREDCAGLCPRCGANLNEGPCGCDLEATDLRWEALGALSLDEFPSGNGHNT
jgi:uncharacterized protein